MRLKQYHEAIDTEIKTNAISTWKEMNVTCLKVEEMISANLCCLHIIFHSDHLEELVNLNEKNENPKELI